MDQKQFESLMAEQDAAFVAKKTAVENEIRSIKIEIEECHKNHDMRVSELKAAILELEMKLADAKKDHAVGRAALMKGFCE